MPSKRSYTVNEETCYPCKYWSQVQWKSGRDPEYHRYCQHPTVQDDPIGAFGGKGRLISTYSNERPIWCPIRGDAEAEREAMADDE